VLPSRFYLMERASTSGKEIHTYTFCLNIKTNEKMGINEDSWTQNEDKLDDVISSVRQREMRQEVEEEEDLFG